MNYLVHDHSRRGKVFATMAEANAYANDIIRNSGVVCLVTETRRKVTHIYDF